MSYVEQTLTAGERIVHRAHLHWYAYTGPAFLALLGLVGLAAGVAWPLMVGAAALLVAFLNARTSEFTVTNRRVVLKVGIIRRRSVELLLSKVESIGVDQGITGRILKFGTVSVGGSGGSREQFKAIADPLEFRRQVQAQTQTQVQAA